MFIERATCILKRTISRGINSSLMKVIKKMYFNHLKNKVSTKLRGFTGMTIRRVKIIVLLSHVALSIQHLTPITVCLRDDSSDKH